jgi:hypothetical protein
MNALADSDCAPDLPRYAVQSVGGGWDLFVVFDRTKGHYASAHITENWVARFRDDMDGYKAATQKAEELNAKEPKYGIDFI